MNSTTELFKELKEVSNNLFNNRTCIDDNLIHIAENVIDYAQSNSYLSIYDYLTAQRNFITEMRTISTGVNISNYKLCINLQNILSKIIIILDSIKLIKLEKLNTLIY